ncbi:hypothetical protein HOLleu_31637 [Holothuria leucospilota]|uniref:Uncharacterized protein n=1 Tax=Holothuria leucospilota TaxID=206669 RepID=A0A9Q1BHE9_HOLLE|nr:hypothetical protein HOLleu_31637 [Holothuria leucospilota]
MANLGILLLILLISRQPQLSSVQAKRVREILQKDLKKILQKIAETERMQNRRINRIEDIYLYSSAENDLESSYFDGDTHNNDEDVIIEPKTPVMTFPLPPPEPINPEKLPSHPPPSYYPWPRGPRPVSSLPMSNRSPRLDRQPPQVPSFPELPNWEELRPKMPHFLPGGIYSRQDVIKRGGNKN